MSTFEQWEASVLAVTKVLKVRFPNLTTEETLKLAGELVRVVLIANLAARPHD